MRLPLVSVAVVLFASSSVASAAPEKVVGLTETRRVEPATGLIDVAIAADGTGLIAYVNADAATTAVLHVMDTADGSEVRTVDLAPYTLAPQRMWFTGKGKDAPVLVVGQASDESGLRAWILDPKSKKAPKAFGPAEAIVLAQRKGKSFVAVRTSKETKKGTVYTFTRYDLKKGKKQGKARTLTLLGDKDVKLGFTLHHWTADGMMAVGTREGEWDKKEDIRMPDTLARLDLLDPAAKLKASAIGDLRAHAKRWEILSTEGGRSVFARIATDLGGVELWRDDMPVTLTLDQPWELYDAKTMVFTEGDDGTVWIGISIDPWNRPAVTRKKEDPAYFDLFRVDGDKAVRVGRVLAPKAHFAIGATGKQLWLLERNLGFDRGGKSLVFYTPA